MSPCSRLLLKTKTTTTKPLVNNNPGISSVQVPLHFTEQSLPLSFSLPLSSLSLIYSLRSLQSSTLLFWQRRESLFVCYPSSTESLQVNRESTLTRFCALSRKIPKVSAVRFQKIWFTFPKLHDNSIKYTKLKVLCCNTKASAWFWEAGPFQFTQCACVCV